MRVTLLFVLTVSAQAAPEITVDSARRVAILEHHPQHTFTKGEVRDSLHALIPALSACYEKVLARRPTVSGVANLKLTVVSAKGLGTAVIVRGFDTAGTLAEAPGFLTCLRASLETRVAPSLGDGTIDLIYPLTFAPQPPDNRDTRWLDAAVRARGAEAWAEALMDAERGLESVASDGTIRRPLIEIAGLSACHLGDVDKTRHYLSLASATADPVIRACAQKAHLDLGTE